MTPTYRRKIKKIREDCVKPFDENIKNKLDITSLNFQKNDSKNLDIFLLLFSIFILFLLFLSNS